MATGEADPTCGDDESRVPLPLPVDGLFDVYIKSKAAIILTATKKGSLLRSQTMHEMIK